MLCLHKRYIKNPLKGYSERRLNALLARNHKGSIKFLPSYMPVPCQDCPLCRLRSTAEVLCRLISASYEYGWMSYFVTLTIEGDNVYDVKYEDVKPLCDAIRRSNREKGTNYQFYITAEYGSKTDRPHYHAMLYGFNGRFDCLRFVKEHYNLGNVTCEPCTLARFRYTANAHVNKCSHVPYKPVYDDGDLYMLLCKKPFVTCSQKLGLKYVLLNADSILNNGYLKIDGICYPVPRTLMDYVYKSRGLSPFVERLTKYTMPTIFDSLEQYRKIARKFNYDDSNANFGPWLVEFSKYLNVAEQMLKRSYNSKFVLKDKSYSV